jgi:hypothetical protein
MSKYGVTMAECPYYQWHEKTKIHCEAFPRGTAMDFPDKASRNEYMLRYCSSLEGCKECKLHEILDEKWGVSDKK